MKTKRFMAVALTTALSAGALYGSVATADTLDNVLAVEKQKSYCSTDFAKAYRQNCRRDQQPAAGLQGG